MHGLRRQLASIVLAIIGAHALTYFLVSVLPDAAVVSLGIESTRQEVLTAFHAAHQNRSYFQVLADLMRLDFGQTLDGIPVARELGAAVSASLPRLILAFLVVMVVSAIAALRVRMGGSQEDLASFLAFLPPYVPPFVGLVLLLSLTLSLGFGTGDVVLQLVAVAALAVAPAALVYAQTCKIMQRNLESDFARTLLAVGATPTYQRFRLIHNVIAEIIPSLEKVFTGLIAVLLFVEPIFGLSGFGTTAIRAIKRSDANLVLGVVVLLGLAVGLFRLLAIVIRRHYGMAS